MALVVGPFPHMLLTSCNVELTTSSSFISLCIETQALIWDLNDDMIENGRRICDGSNNKLKLSIHVCHSNMEKANEETVRRVFVDLNGEFKT